MDVSVIKKGLKKVDCDNSKRSKEDALMAMIDIDEYIATNEDPVPEGANLSTQLEIFDDYTEKREFKNDKRARDKNERNLKQHAD